MSKKTDLIATIIASGITLTGPTLRRMTIADLEALLPQQPERCVEHPAYDADYCPACGTATVIGEQAETATREADHAAAAEFTADPAEQPEFVALATKEWRGNYNTVLAPAAEAIAAGYSGVEVRTVNVSTMLRQTDIAGPLATEFLDLLIAVEAAALAATKSWQKTLDRKDASDMEKYNQNRSFLAGYLGVAAQRLTGSKKTPAITFAKDMDKALRHEALKAGAAAARTEG
ncbi:hypothetical protein [Nocardioides sp.]|uniref:hypothetical protein n=1 Tax=Nocardioides sp. TaxID=35761 RepID=UPI00261EEE36|nr:hypothetical protein [Nocardioides sp.]MCW2738873.1 hypothetical protein [Nocardioides sp.]